MKAYKIMHHPKSKKECVGTVNHKEREQKERVRMKRNQPDQLQSQSFLSRLVPPVC